MSSCPTAARPERLSILGVRALLGMVAAAALVAAPARAAPSLHRHTLRQAEAAFYRAGLPFQRDWKPGATNPYLARQANPRAEIPAPFRRHLIGWAGGTNSATFRSWQVFVFDTRSEAVLFGRTWCKPPSCVGLIRTADNVTYVGSPLAAASRAMARLRDS